MRTILDLIIKEVHLKPQLINNPLDLKLNIEKSIGHKINNKSFLEKYKLIKEK